MFRKHYLTKKRTKWQMFGELGQPLLFGALVYYNLRYQQERSGGCPNPQAETRECLAENFGYQEFVPVMLAYFIPSVSAVGSRFILQSLITEKQQRMRGTLSLMSLSAASYGLSYFLFQALFALIGSILITWPFMGSIHIFGVGTREEAVWKGIQLMTCVTLFNVSQVPFAMSLSTFFSDPNLGNNLGGLILYAMTLLPIYLLQFPKSRVLLYLLCPILPVCSSTIVICSIIDNHTMEPLIPLLMSTSGIHIGFAWFSLIIACPLHLTLYTYLD